MGMFEWKPEYCLGHEHIDKEHQRLFKLANDMHAAMTLGKGKEALSQTFASLVDYTKTHFAHEEQVMLANNYPEYAEHKAAHYALTGRVLELQAAFDAGRMGITIELLQFLKEWLRTHIGETDRKVAVFLKNRAAA